MTAPALLELSAKLFGALALVFLGIAAGVTLSYSETPGWWRQRFAIRPVEARE